MIKLLHLSVVDVPLPASAARCSSDIPGDPGADCSTISCNGELSRELSETKN